jgi:uncharacterized membrane protein YkvA (DUF1232 family)
MTPWEWASAALGAAVVLYGGLVGALALIGRGSEARAIARFVPDCVVLFRGLLSDPRVPRSRKLLLLALVAYLATPIDLIPDFIPVAGQLDDAILVALVLRRLLRGAGPELVREHWRGPEASLGALLRLAGQAAPA